MPSGSGKNPKRPRGGTSVRGKRGPQLGMVSRPIEKLVLSTRTPSRNCSSRRHLTLYLCVRKLLRRKVKFYIEMERKKPSSLGWELDSVGNMIAAAANTIAHKILNRAVPAFMEQDEFHGIPDVGGFDSEVILFLEAICEQMEILLRFPSAVTEEEERLQIPVLQSISDTIRDFCAARGHELEKGGQATKESDAESQATKESNAESQATKELDADLDEELKVESQATKELDADLDEELKAESQATKELDADLDAESQATKVLDAVLDEELAAESQATKELDAESQATKELDAESQATKELDAESQATKELDAELKESKAAMELDAELKESKAAMELETEEQEGSLIKAGVGRDQIPMETEEAPLVDIQAAKKVKAAIELEAPWPDSYYKGRSRTEMQEEDFATFLRGWYREQGRIYCYFEDLSLLSPMMFTHCSPGCSSIAAIVGRTFQVYSVKIAEIKGIQWPLKVYGVVAARDDVDNRRNPLFLRSRNDYQIVHEKDPFLQLTGPCRAIVSEEPLEIEIILRVNRGKESDDRPLISDGFAYNRDNFHRVGSTHAIENHLCKIEISYQQLKQSVQATFFDFHVGEPSPFDFGVKVACSSLPEDSIEGENVWQVVLSDSRCRKVPMGNLRLSRQVVSVQLQGKLRVLIQSYAPSGSIAAHESIIITPQQAYTSVHSCQIGGSEVKFTVAWSLLLADRSLMLMDGYVDPLKFLPPMDPYVLEKLGISE